MDVSLRGTVSMRRTMSVRWTMSLPRGMRMSRVAIRRRGQMLLREVEIYHKRQMIAGPFGHRTAHHPGSADKDITTTKRLIERSHREISRERTESRNGRRDVGEAVLRERTLGQRVAPIVRVTRDEH